MCCAISAGTNLALNKHTSQISTFSPTSGSFRAVDGFYDQNVFSGRCIHTALYATNVPVWWAVDLNMTYFVQGVLLFNRAECCGKLKHEISDMFQHYIIVT
jgi:hypothetical protein